MAFAKPLFLLLLLVAAVVGDKITWEVPLKDATKKITNKGDMNLTWTGLHGVYELPSRKCPDTFAPGNGLKELVKPQTGGNYIWTPPANAAVGSQYWLADPVGDNCKKGLLLQITIKEKSATP